MTNNAGAATRMQPRPTGKVELAPRVTLVRRVECPACAATAVGDRWPEAAYDSSPVRAAALEGAFATNAMVCEAASAVFSQETASPRWSPSRTGLAFSLIVTGFAALTFLSMYSGARGRAQKLEQQVRQSTSEATGLRDQVTGLQGDVTALKTKFKLAVADPVELTGFELFPAGDAGQVATLDNYVEFPVETLTNLQARIKLRNLWYGVDTGTVEITFGCTANMQACPVPEARTVQVAPDQVTVEQHFVVGPDANAGWSVGQYQLEVRINGSVRALLSFGVR